MSDGQAPRRFEDLVRVWALPAARDLVRLRSAGIRSIVNVSNMPMGEGYDPMDLAGLDVVDLPLRDVFTVEPALDRPIACDEAAYRAVTDAVERRTLLLAVAATRDRMAAGRRTLLCCNQGLGRSPTVAAGAFLCAEAISIAEAIDRTRRIRPPTHVSRMTCSALAYVQRHAAEGALSRPVASEESER